MKATIRIIPILNMTDNPPLEFVGKLWKDGKGVYNIPKTDEEALNSIRLFDNEPVDVDVFTKEFIPRAGVLDFVFASTRGYEHVADVSMEIFEHIVKTNGEVLEIEIELTIKK